MDSEWMGVSDWRVHGIIKRWSNQLNYCMTWPNGLKQKSNICCFYLLLYLLTCYENDHHSRNAKHPLTALVWLVLGYKLETLLLENIDQFCVKYFILRRKMNSTVNMESWFYCFYLIWQTLRNSHYWSHAV